MDYIYLEAISTPYIGFGNKTVLKMLNHLYDVHTKILHNDLVLKNERMNALWDPDQHREQKSPLFSKYGNLGTIFVTILY